MKNFSAYIDSKGQIHSVESGQHNHFLLQQAKKIPPLVILHPLLGLLLKIPFMRGWVRVSCMNQAPHRMMLIFSPIRITDAAKKSLTEHLWKFKKEADQHSSEPVEYRIGGGNGSYSDLNRLIEYIEAASKLPYRKSPSQQNQRE